MFSFMHVVHSAYSYPNHTGIACYRVFNDKCVDHHIFVLPAHTELGGFVNQCSERYTHYGFMCKANVMTCPVQILLSATYSTVQKSSC